MNTTVRQHPNAALTPIARRKMADLMLAGGWSVKATAERFQVSVKTARKWRDRYTSEGTAGLLDRSSRPRRSPKSTPAVKQAEVIKLRQHRRRGAAWIGHEVAFSGFYCAEDPQQSWSGASQTRRSCHTDTPKTLRTRPPG